MGGFIVGLAKVSVDLTSFDDWSSFSMNYHATTTTLPNVNIGVVNVGVAVVAAVPAVF